MERQDKLVNVGCAIVFWSAFLAVLIPVVIKLWKWALN
jgi:hypothetical protein